jgi:hypothetical protein
MPVQHQHRRKRAARGSALRQDSRLSRLASPRSLTCDRGCESRTIPSWKSGTSTREPLLGLIHGAGSVGQSLVPNPRPCTGADFALPATVKGGDSVRDSPGPRLHLGATFTD